MPATTRPVDAAESHRPSLGQANAIARIVESGTQGLVRRRRMTYQLIWSARQSPTFRWPERIKKSVSASLVSQLPRFWVGKLAHYGLHRNDEHCVALFEEAVRYTGLHLENDLARFRLLVDDAAAPTSDRSVVSGRPGSRRAHGPAEVAASSSRFLTRSRGSKASRPCGPISSQRSSSWPLFATSCSGELIPARLE